MEKLKNIRVYTRGQSKCLNFICRSMLASTNAYQTSTPFFVVPHCVRDDLQITNLYPRLIKFFKFSIAKKSAVDVFFRLIKTCILNDDVLIAGIHNTS